MCSFNLSGQLLTTIFGLSLPLLALAKPATPVLNFDEAPVEVTLEKDDGGRVADGSLWSSKELRGKVHIMMYVDPDEADLNEKLADRLKTEQFSPDLFASVAVINMAAKAAFKPAFIINSVLRSKQEKFKLTTYVKDDNKVLVKKWGLADDNYDVLLFDRDGKLLFLKEGKLNDTEIDEVVKLIKENTKKLKSSH